MSKMLRLVGVLLLMAVASAAWGGRPQETPLQYKVQLRLVEAGPDGQSRVLASSLVLTTEDKPEVVNADADVPLPKGVETTEPLHAGRSFSFRVFRSGGRLFVDAKAELADVRSATEDGVRIATRGFRLVEAIALGKPVTVPVDSGKTGEKGSLCWEILVSDPALEKMPPGSRPFPRPTGRLKPRPR